MAVWSPADGLLARHFLQGLVENDLQAPDADQRENLATVAAGLLTAGTFISLMMGLRYVSTPFLTPGRAAVATLNDTFLFVGWSFVIMALVAIAKWDGLSLDPRDTSILGPLPVKRTAIVRAKLAALVLFASGFAVALNGAPTLIYPTLVAAALRARMIDALQLAAAHIVATMGAGLFGFASVIAIRETSRALLGAALFRRVSPALQGCLLAAFVMGFLLLPARSSAVARTWLAPENRLRDLTPPVWFVGLHETIVREAIVGQPVGPLPVWPQKYEREAMPLYRSRVAVLRELGGRASVALLVAVAIALSAYTWNLRRLPIENVHHRRAWARAIAGAILRAVLVRRQAIRAGFFFTLQTLARSVAHRATMAIAAAVAAAAIVLNTQLSGGEVQPSSIPLSFLGMQLAVVTALVVGFRHAMRFPADTRATWTFQLSWSGDDRPYIAGVKRAGLTALLMPAIVALLPLNTLVMGWRAGSWHLVFGFLLGGALLDASMLGVRRLPFAASYLPADSLRWAGPLGFFGFFFGAYVFGSVERFALESRRGSVALAGALIGLIGFLRLVDALQRRTPPVVDFVELPAPPTQRLMLSE